MVLKAILGRWQREAAKSVVLVVAMIVRCWVGMRRTVLATSHDSYHSCWHWPDRIEIKDTQKEWQWRIHPHTSISMSTNYKLQPLYYGVFSIQNPCTHPFSSPKSHHTKTNDIAPTMAAADGALSMEIRPRYYTHREDIVHTFKCSSWIFFATAGSLLVIVM